MRALHVRCLNAYFLGLPFASSRLGDSVNEFGGEPKIAHFDREVIPERRMHAKGSGAHGVFTVTHDISHLTRARLFAAIGQQCPVFVRFSTVAGERGAADAEREVLCVNTARHMADTPEFIKRRHIEHCHRCDPEYGAGVARALGLEA